MRISIYLLSLAITVLLSTSFSANATNGTATAQAGGVHLKDAVVANSNWHFFSWSNPAGPPVSVNQNPFTFTCTAPGCVIDVGDRGNCGDRFHVMDGAVVLGDTSTTPACTAASPDTHSDSDAAWAQPADVFSRGSYWLPAGVHSINLTVIAFGPNFSGSGFYTSGGAALRVRDGVANPAAVAPVPTTGQWALVLLALGLVSVGAARIRRHRMG